MKLDKFLEEYKEIEKISDFKEYLKKCDRCNHFTPEDHLSENLICAWCGWEDGEVE